MPKPAADPAVTPQLVKDHGLTAEEFARIKKNPARESNSTELGIFSVTWSEHCFYKSSKKVRISPRDILPKNRRSRGTALVGDILWRAESLSKDPLSPQTSPLTFEHEVACRSLACACAACCLCTQQATCFATCSGEIVVVSNTQTCQRGSPRCHVSHRRHCISGALSL